MTETNDDRKKLVSEVAGKSEAVQAATQRAKELTEPWRTRLGTESTRTGYLCHPVPRFRIKSHLTAHLGLLNLFMVWDAKKRRPGIFSSSPCRRGKAAEGQCEGKLGKA